MTTEVLMDSRFCSSTYADGDSTPCRRALRASQRRDKERTSMDGESMLIGGRWRSAIGTGKTEDVTSPYDGSVVGTVPVGGVRDVDAAITAADRGAAVWRRTPAHERFRILMRAAELVDERGSEIARMLSAENGKTITEATAEVSRSGALIRLAAFEGSH